MKAIFCRVLFAAIFFFPLYNAHADIASYAITDCNALLENGARNLSVGQQLTIKTGARAEQSKVVTIIGSYGGQILMATDMRFSYTVYQLPRTELQGLGLATDMFDFPKMVPQVGPTCLPTVLAYLQDLYASAGGGLMNLVPSACRIGWMAAFTTFNLPVLVDRSHDFQLAQAEAALSASGVGFRRVSKIEDVIKHLQGPGQRTALLGVGVGRGSFEFLNMATDSKQEPLVASPTASPVQGKHAMLVTSYVVDANGGKGFMVIDPLSGTAFPIDLEKTAERIEAAILIDVSSSGTRGSKSQ